MYARKHSRRTSAAAQTRDVLLATLAASHEDVPELESAVARAAQRVGAQFGLTGVWLQELGHAADLRDIGNVAVPATILAKPGPLTESEWEFVRRHPVIGERILAAAPALADAARIVRSSHERFDGTGYPDRLAGEAIALEARIISVCDAYHAMTSPRPYRPALVHAEALDELRRGAGTQFDPAVVEAFVRTMADRAVTETPAEQIPSGDPDPRAAAALG